MQATKMDTKFEKRTLRKVLSTKRSVDTTTVWIYLSTGVPQSIRMYLFHAWGALEKVRPCMQDIGTKGLISLTRYSIDSHPERSAAAGDPCVND